jgi:hypothetical protein
MNLILDSHPDILSIDENRFSYPDLNTYLNAAWLPSFVAFKLPRYASSIPFIKDLKGLRVIWCIRNPLDTVWSMMKLQLPLPDANQVSWSVHPSGARAEILNGYWALEDEIKSDIEPYMFKYTEIMNKKPEQRSRLDSVFIGSLCWKIKNELPSLYESKDIRFLQVKYEELVTESETNIEKLLEYIGVDWDEDVLRHHELHKGTSIGNTDNERPIDSKGVDAGLKNLSDEEVDLVLDMCGRTAEKCGYLLD